MDYYADIKRLRAEVGDTRLANAIHNSDFKNFKEFCEGTTEAEMLRIPNFGRKSLKTVIQLAREKGIKIKSYVPENPKVIPGRGDLVPLSTLSSNAIKALTGYDKADMLPKGERCSQPFVWDDKWEIPLAIGTPVSFWKKSDYPRYDDPPGWWDAQISKEEHWKEIKVYRVRHIGTPHFDLSLPVKTVKVAEERIAEALERIATALENLK